MLDTRSPEQKFVKAPISKSIPLYLSQREKDLDPSPFYNMDTRRQAYDSCLEKLEAWIRNYVSFSDFPYRYLTQGASEGIMSWINVEKRQVLTLEQDYTWVKSFPKVQVVPDLKLIPHSVSYLSQPFFNDGNYKPYLDYSASLEIPIALDLTWLGCTEPRPVVLPKNVEFVFFSLSKSWGTWPWRVGFLFSKTPFRCFELYKEAGYFSQTCIHVVDHLTANFEFGDQFQFFKPLQKRICKEVGLMPSESYLVGINTLGKKVSLTDQYQKIPVVKELYI